MDHEADSILETTHHIFNLTSIDIKRCIEKSSKMGSVWYLGKGYYPNSSIQIYKPFCLVESDARSLSSPLFLSSSTFHSRGWKRQAKRSPFEPFWRQFCRLQGGTVKCSHCFKGENALLEGLCVSEQHRAGLEVTISLLLFRFNTTI